MVSLEFFIDIKSF